MVASFFARMRADDDVEHWQIEEIHQLKLSLERKAAGVAHELFRDEKNREVLRRTPEGILSPAVEVHADGPLLRSYLSAFSAKLGMALYREHIGSPLPIEGKVHSHWYLNAGLSHSTADKMLQMLPIGSGLRQGKFHVDDQFSYRFNCDDKSILAALARFHTGLYVFVIATSKPGLYISNIPDLPTGAITAPGELIAMMPAQGQRYWT